MKLIKKNLISGGHGGRVSNNKPLKKPPKPLLLMMMKLKSMKSKPPQPLRLTTIDNYHTFVVYVVHVL